MSRIPGDSTGQQSRINSSMSRTRNQVPNQSGTVTGRAGVGGGANQASSVAVNSNPRRTLGNKDLIIRMLAEIFQVRQDEDGQLRWQQVSSSLVPVSLYSRTTSSWLNYLLATSSAAQATDPTSTMSPDSRNFLILLQQFHQARMSTQAQLRQQEQFIVFQVVGHDFIDGQCKRILNVKIQQPGTRLGQASDYFVYWREQSSSSNQRNLLNLQFQHQFSSSITSNNSFIPRTNDRQSGIGHHSPNYNQDQPFHESQTWGLNFASVNDAKLFFDICSLNLVDLDFNSEYFKQVPLTDRQQRLVGQTLGTSNFTLSPVSSMMINQRRPLSQQQQTYDQRASRSQLQQQQQQQQQQLEDYHRRTTPKNLGHSLRSQAVKRQSSSLKCSSCQQTVKNPRYTVRQSNENTELLYESCPVHGQQQSNTMRLRSRSTTRNREPRADEFRRARSYSTPASPENGCPVHQKRKKHLTAAVCDYCAGIDNVREPKSLNRDLKQQQLSYLDSLEGQTNCSGRPPKPARGLMRTSTIEQNDDQSPSILSKQNLCYKSSSRTKLDATKLGVTDGFSGLPRDEEILMRRTNKKCDRANENEFASQSRRKFTGAKYACNDVADTFDTISRRDARLARARYANSKNMKEFLSLDVGGIQANSIFNDRFQRQQMRLASNNAAGRQSEAKLLKTGSDGRQQSGGGKQSCSGSGAKQSDKCVENLSLKQHSGDQSGGEELNLKVSANYSNHAEADSAIKSRTKLDGDDHGNNLTCNVSTTTDDLPLDPKMRKRMLKLTSEEAISERTEPKSSLTSTTLEQNLNVERENRAGPLEGQEKCQQLQQDKIDRQVRAVSLEPQLGLAQARGLKPRSDSGRRRSLERSTCVDLDTLLPANSFKKMSRLSPLPQSVASPMVPESEKSSLPTGNCAMDCNITTNIVASALANAQYLHDHPSMYDSTEFHSGLRIKSDGKFHYENEGSSFECAGHRPDHTNDQANGNSNINTSRKLYHVQPRTMATFKSAPDITRLNGKNCLKSRAKVNNPLSTTINGSYGRAAIQSTAPMVPCDAYQHNRHFIKADSRDGTQTMPKMMSTLSTYAVPLCSDQQMDEHSSNRQYHSCPSSLRRRRRPVGHYVEETDHEFVNAAENFGGGYRCQHCSCARAPRGFVRNHSPNYYPIWNDTEIENQCVSCCDTSNRGPTSDKEAREPLRCLDCNLIYDGAVSCRLHYPHHHHRNQHSHLEPAHRPTQRSTIYPSQVEQRQIQSGSRQSARSPLRYGLYESDYEEGQADDEVDVGSARLLDQVSYCHDQTAGRSTYRLDNRIVKPFQGYDQTMARASLKSRQRSRSQPPRECFDEQTIHMNKSMENVKKLIQEVQHELDMLKRFPMSTASIDMREGETHTIVSGGAENLGLYQGDQRTKMSLDERSNVAGQLTNVGLASERQPTKQVNSTSATRRAGQFKCAGAIRKAGFLSVKKWILKRRQSIELARKQGWKRYWVCLRGTALLFHSVIDRKETDDADGSICNHQDQIDLLSWIKINCNNQTLLLTNLLQSESQQENLSHEVFLKNISQCYIEEEPRHLIIIDGAIAQPIPEHPRRDFVFCLSTTFGDAYLFQASCQLESDNWIAAIHNACAASIARELTRDEAIKLFESKIRHLEMEADKKLFLKQRLDSRLTSMLTMSKITSDTDDELARINNTVQSKNQESRSTLRSLLHRLSQQLLTLENFIERLYCEIYQLSCYSSSCDAQRAFYCSNTGLQQLASSGINLPHPKTLLMHVSKPTKLLLIRLGVFTVSSFHAYIHARQESAETIVNKLQQQSSQQQPSCPSSPLELRIRSQSVGENPLIKNEDTTKLDTDTEELIQITNLKPITVHVNKDLYESIRESVSNVVTRVDGESDSNDDYSVRDGGDFVVINLKMNSSSTSASIVKQVLKIIQPHLEEFEFLYYNLKLINSIANQNSSTKAVTTSKKAEEEQSHYVAKRRDTLEDWSHFDHIELFRKSIYQIKITRSRLDEEAAAPFGISIEGQLLTGKLDNLLNVYCSYIEWGSVADKAGIRDEDEFLSINGTQTGDLDMMFVECLIQDATELKLTIRSNSESRPANSVCVDKSTWTPMGGNGDKDEDDDDIHGRHYEEYVMKQAGRPSLGESSKIISDEHITSLVCPPPPAQSDAFLRTDTNLIRRKSDLGSTAQPEEVDFSFKNVEDKAIIPKSISQHALIDATIDCAQDVESELSLSTANVHERPSQYVDADVLAKQLLRKTERLTRLLGRDVTDPVNSDSKTDSVIPSADASRSQELNEKQSDCGSISNNNLVERFRKSVLELIETEFAYVRHLETINEHYMIPLEKVNFLNFIDLRQLNQSVVSLLKFHRDFFNDLITKLMSKFKLGNLSTEDEFERLNFIVKHLESCHTLDKLTMMFEAVAELFLAEVENFKLYTSYCIAYSRLQRILHPKHLGKSNLPTSSISLIPSSLNTFSSSLVAPNTFVTSNRLNIATHAQQQQRSHLQQKESLKSIEMIFSIGSASDSGNQLKELSDFLTHLDSSSSSVSLSCSSKSSITEQNQQQQQTNQPEKQTKQCTKQSSINSSTSLNQTTSSFRKGVHQQNFESYLIKPIQRIVKYPMLLGSIATATNQLYPDESFYKDIQHSIRQMELVIGHVNDTQRVHDEYGIVFDNIERQYFDQQANDSAKTNTTLIYGPHQPAISLNIDQLLYFGQVEWLNINEFAPKLKISSSFNMNQVVFVFKSCVVFISKEQVVNKSAKKKASGTTTHSSSTNQPTYLNGASRSPFQGNSIDYNEAIRYQTLIPVSEVQVRSSPIDSKAATQKVTATQAAGKPTTADKYQWEMFQCSSSNSNSSLLTKSSSRKQGNSGKAYLLACQTNDERNRFLRKIRLIIRESVRNMSLPLTRSPSIKSLNTTAHKKLSTSSTDSNTNTNSSCSQATSLTPDSNSRNAEQEHSSAITVSAKKVDCRFSDQPEKGTTKYRNGIEVNN